MSISVSSINRAMDSIARNQAILHESMESHIRNDTVHLLIDYLREESCAKCASCVFTNILKDSVAIRKEMDAYKRSIVFSSARLGTISIMSSIASILILLGSYIGEMTKSYNYEIDLEFMKAMAFFQIIYCLLMKASLTSIQSHMCASVQYVTLCGQAYVDYRGFLGRLAMKRNQFPPDKLELLLGCSRKIREILSERAFLCNVGIVGVIATLKTNIESLSTGETKEFLRIIKHMATVIKTYCRTTSPKFIFDPIIFLLFLNLAILLFDRDPPMDPRIVSSLSFCVCLAGTLAFLSDTRKMDSFVRNIFGMLRPISSLV